MLTVMLVAQTFRDDISRAAILGAENWVALAQGSGEHFGSPEPTLIVHPAEATGRVLSSTSRD